MFFNQLFQADCLRVDVIFVSSSKSMTKSTGKRIEIITKLVFIGENRFLAIIYFYFFSFVSMSSDLQVCSIVFLQGWWKTTETKFAESKGKLLLLLNII